MFVTAPGYFSVISETIMFNCTIQWLFYILIVELGTSDWTEILLPCIGKVTLIPLSISAWESNWASMPTKYKKNKNKMSSYCTKLSIIQNT